MPDVKVDVIGLRALIRDLKSMGDAGSSVLKELQAAGRRAAEPVAAAVSAALPKVDVPGEHGHPAGTIAATTRILGTKSGAKVAVGSKRLPYAGPLEFGGWPPGRNIVSAGRYIFPAAVGPAAAAGSVYADGIQRALDGFSWTNEGDSVHD